MGCACLTNWLSSIRSSEVVSATHRIPDFLPFVGGLVFDALVFDSLIRALIRLEYCSIGLFVERFIATASGKSPMCIIIVEALRRKCGAQNYLVLAGAVRNAYQPGKGDSYGVAPLALFRGRG